MWPGSMMLGLFNAHKEYAGKARQAHFLRRYLHVFEFFGRKRAFF